MNTARIFILGLLLTRACGAETVSILVNIGCEDSSARSLSLATTAKDFQAADPKITQTTPVNQVSAPKHMVWYVLGLLTAQNNKGGTHEINLEGTPQGCNNAGTNKWNHGVAISDNYLHTFKSELDNPPSTLTINGIKMAAGTITLTVWAIGAGPEQQATVTPSYAGVTLKSKSTNFGSNISKPTDAIPYVQFTFQADGKTDSLSFQWENPGNYSCLNGFSLSYDEKK